MSALLALTLLMVQASVDKPPTPKQCSLDTSPCYTIDSRGDSTAGFAVASSRISAVYMNGKRLPRKNWKIVIDGTATMVHVIGLPPAKKGSKEIFQVIYVREP